MPWIMGWPAHRQWAGTLGSALGVMLIVIMTQKTALGRSFLTELLY